MDNNDTPVTTANENKALLIAAHLAGVLNFFVFGIGLIVPLGIWLALRKKDPFVDSHGKAILNFQLTLALVLLALIVLQAFDNGGIVFTVVGIYGLFVFGIQLIGPILGALAAYGNRPFKYFLSIPFLR